MLVFIPHDFSCLCVGVELHHRPLDAEVQLWQDIFDVLHTEDLGKSTLQMYVGY